MEHPTIIFYSKTVSLMREIEGHDIPPISFFWVNYLRLNLMLPP